MHTSPLAARRVLIALGVVAALAATAVAVINVRPSPASDAGLEGVPRLKHVWIIVLENKDFATTWGPKSEAVYLRSLAPGGAFAPYYYGVGHLSAGNYIAMTSGQSPTPPFMSDCLNYSACLGSEAGRPDGGRNLTDQLTQRRLSWKAYMESMGTPCKHPAVTDATDPYQTGYATRHDPFVYYPSVAGAAAPNPTCAQHVVDGSALSADLRQEATTPNYSFIVPNTCDDGHDACAGGSEERYLDHWLSTVVPAITASPAYQDRGALFITFDESDVGAAPTNQNEYKGCCASGPDGSGLTGGGQVGLLMLSPLARTGTAAHRPYDHFSLLRTVEDGFGIGEHLNQAGAAGEYAMDELFASAPAGGGGR